MRLLMEPDGYRLHGQSARDLRKVTINFGSCNQHQYTHSGMNSAKFPE